MGNLFNPRTTIIEAFLIKKQGFDTRKVKLIHHNGFLLHHWSFSWTWGKHCRTCPNSSKQFEQFEFLRQLSNNPANIVIGLVRDKKATDKKVSEELDGRKNIHIVQGDMTDYASLKNAADYTADVTGGALDYLIANAGLISRWSGLHPIGVLYVVICSAINVC